VPSPCFLAAGANKLQPPGGNFSPSNRLMRWPSLLTNHHLLVLVHSPACEHGFAPPWRDTLKHFLCPGFKDGLLCWFPFFFVLLAFCVPQIDFFFFLRVRSGHPPVKWGPILKMERVLFRISFFWVFVLFLTLSPHHIPWGGPHHIWGPSPPFSFRFQCEFWGGCPPLLLDLGSVLPWISWSLVSGPGRDSPFFFTIFFLFPNTVCSTKAVSFCPQNNGFFSIHACGTGRLPCYHPIFCINANVTFPHFRGLNFPF